MLNPGEIAGIAGAGFVVVAGSSTYGAAVAHRRRAFRRRLRDPDPGTRVIALEATSERRVYPYLDALTERALVESDPEVQEALARLVSSADWNESSDRRLLQLKAWAERVTAPSPQTARTSIDDRGSDALSGPATATPPSAEPPADAGPGVAPGAPTAELRRVDPLSESGPSRSDPVETWLVPDPWEDKPIDSPANGSRPEPELETVAAREGTGAAKAEQSAIELLHEAGYGVERPQHAKRDTPSVPAEPRKTNRRQSIEDFLAQRVITVTILEEAVRRMRAENDRLESAFAGELDLPHGSDRGTREPTDPVHGA